MKKTSIFLLAIIPLSGCSLLPSMRVFEKKVPVEQASPAIVESQRQGAKFIEQVSIPSTADPIRALAAIHSVAIPLSSSLGEPKKAITIDSRDEVIAALKKSVLSEQKKADDWKQFAQKYGNKTIEGTGIDLAAPGALLGLVTLAALFIFVPGTLTVALFVIRRAKSTVTQIAQSVEEYAAKNPTAAADLKGRLSSNLDRAEKAVVSEAKKYINPDKVAEAAKPV